MPSFRLSAVRVGVQPAAELRHLQRHEHVRHVQRALLPLPCPQSAVEPSPLRAACATVARRLRPSCMGHTSPRTACPPCDSAGRKLPVHRQQAAHPLRVGGHLGLPLRLELGSGKLLAELSPLYIEVRDWVESAATTRLTPARNLRSAETYADVRGEGVKKRLRAARQPNKGCAA
eukprot:scaffold5552_cov52-Phaeocystis_antarctica.AAC.4